MVDDTSICVDEVVGRHRVDHANDSASAARRHHVCPTNVYAQLLQMQMRVGQPQDGARVAAPQPRVGHLDFGKLCGVRMRECVHTLTFKGFNHCT